MKEFTKQKHLYHLSIFISFWLTAEAIQQDFSSQATLWRSLLQVFFNILKDAFNNFLQLFHAFCVKVEKYGEVHDFRPTCYGQVHPNLKAVCSKIFMCNSTHRFVKKLSCFSQIGLTLLYYEHFVFIKSQFCY